MGYLEKINNDQQIIKKEYQTGKAKTTYFLLSAATSHFLPIGFMHVDYKGF